jgi:methyl-accepting chemotaxis protein
MRYLDSVVDELSDIANELKDVIKDVGNGSVTLEEIESALQNIYDSVDSLSTGTSELRDKFQALI